MAIYFYVLAAVFIAAFIWMMRSMGGGNSGNSAHGAHGNKGNGHGCCG